MRIYYDLETEGLPESEISKLIPEFEAGANLKDPVKIAAQIAEKKAEWLDKCALRAITGKIVAVTYCHDSDEPFMQIGDERELIESMLAILKNCISLNDQAYAWNGSGFDLPFLCQRAAVHGIPAFKDLMQQRGSRFSWHDCLIDPKLIWSNYSPDHTGTSLKSVALALGVGEKTGNGKDFAELLKTNPADAEKYAKLDVDLLRKVVGRMGV